MESNSRPRKVMTNQLPEEPMRGQGWLSVPSLAVALNTLERIHD
jgi:hypothetical protein